MTAVDVMIVCLHTRLPGHKREEFEEIVRAQLWGLNANGYKIVPVEPPLLDGGKRDPK